MAEYNGDNFDILEGNTSGQVAQGLYGGKLRVQYDTYTANALASGDTINVAKLPKNATFIEAIIKHEDLGTGVTLQLGDSNDDDRYVEATDAASAGVIRGVDGIGYTVSEETDLFLKIGGASTASSDKVIKVAVIYTLE